MDNRRDGPTKKAYMTECEDILRAIGDTDATFGSGCRPVRFVRMTFEICQNSHRVSLTTPASSIAYADLSGRWHQCSMHRRLRPPHARNGWLQMRQRMRPPPSLLNGRGNRETYGWRNPRRLASGVGARTVRTPTRGSPCPHDSRGGYSGRSDEQSGSMKRNDHNNSDHNSSKCSRLRERLVRALGRRLYGVRENNAHCEQDS